MIKECCIAVPVAESVNPVVLQSMLNVVNYAANKGIRILETGVTHRELIDNARNKLTEAFLKTPTEWIFWMDSDMTFPKETIVELFKVAEEKNAKMVSGIYYQRKGKNFPCLWSRDIPTEEGRVSGTGSIKADRNKYVGSFMFPHPDKKEPFIAHAAGFGCVLVHRSIFEVMERPWFKFVENTCSEDFYFFVNAKELGFELWVTPNLELGHIGDPPVITKKDFLKNMEKSTFEIDSLKI